MRTKRLNDATPDEWDRIKNNLRPGAAVPSQDPIYAGPDAPAVKPFDAVERPEHYNNGAIECIDYIRQQLADQFSVYCEGAIMKYMHRWRYKNGVQDLKKARWYLDKLIQEEEI